MFLLFSRRWHWSTGFIFSYLHCWGFWDLCGCRLHWWKSLHIPYTAGQLSLRVPLLCIASGGVWISFVFLALPSCSQKPPAASIRLFCNGWGMGGWDEAVLACGSALPPEFRPRVYRLLRLECFFFLQLLWHLPSWGLKCQVEHRGIGWADSCSCRVLCSVPAGFKHSDFFVLFLWP